MRRHNLQIRLTTVKEERGRKGSGANGTVAGLARTYDDLLSSSSARAGARGLVRRACGLGRRFTARGSTRPGRFPTVWPARFFWATATRCAAVGSSSTTRTSQLAAMDCRAAEKLSWRGDWPDSRADCLMSIPAGIATRRIRLYARRHIHISLRTMPVDPRWDRGGWPRRMSMPIVSLIARRSNSTRQRR